MFNKVLNGGLERALSKLSFIERQEVNKYINIEINKKVQECNRLIDNAKATLNKDLKEIKDYYFEKNEKAWDRLGKTIKVSMRENHISEERIKRIDKRILELNKDNDILLGEETKSEYKILAEPDFQKLFELLAYKYCNSCTSRNNKCEVYPLMKKYGVPTVNEGFKCKYAYKRKLKMSCKKDGES